MGQEKGKDAQGESKWLEGTGFPSGSFVASQDFLGPTQDKLFAKNTYHYMCVNETGEPRRMLGELGSAKEIQGFLRRAREIQEELGEPQRPKEDQGEPGKTRRSKAEPRRFG